MRTAVFQSFRTENVPAWLSACLESARAWAAAQGFAYRFYDDRFFDLVPDRVRKRASAHKCLLADYARLVAARDLLDEGWDRVVWLDADALVFDPENFTLPVESGYAFCREVWLDRIAFGKPQFKLTVNNAISVFCRDQAIIDFYLDSANAILESDQPLSALSIGTEFLVRLQRARRFPLIATVGIFGPEMAARYLSNDGRFLQPYLRYQTSPLCAANLCLSHQQADAFGNAGIVWDEANLLALIRRLQADSGRSLNAWFDRGYASDGTEFDRPLSRYIGTRHALKSLLQTVQGK